MTAPAVVIVRHGVHALRRSTTWWGIGIVAVTLLNAAFWPSLKGSEALEGFEEMGELLEAFGAQDLTTAAGYLDGQVYALMLPVLRAAMAIAGTSAITAGDEDAGRLEVLHALPVSRSALWIARWTAGFVVLFAVTGVTTVLMVAGLEVFSFDEVGAARVVAATLACGVLAAFFASIVYAAAGLGATRGRAVSVAIGVLLASYVVAFLLPIADSLDGAEAFSPWHWAIGAQPVRDGIDARSLLAVLACTAALVAVGTAGVNRRDLRTP